jgi:ABC-2 type transport system permease protein
VSFVIIVVTQFIMLLISTAALLPSGLASTTWANFNLFQQSLILLYGLVAIALWHAPIFGWALLISGWVRRATFLWAVLPLLAIGFFEKITFNTSYFASMLKDRLLGFAPEAFEFSAHAVPRLTPGRYLSSPGLWLGLVFAAVFIAAAIRLRRYRGPL